MIHFCGHNFHSHRVGTSHCNPDQMCLLGKLNRYFRLLWLLSYDGHMMVILTLFTQLSNVTWCAKAAVRDHRHWGTGPSILTSNIVTWIHWSTAIHCRIRETGTDRDFPLLLQTQGTIWTVTQFTYTYVRCSRLVK